MSHNDTTVAKWARLWKGYGTTSYIVTAPFSLALLHELRKRRLKILAISVEKLTGTVDLHLGG